MPASRTAWMMASEGCAASRQWMGPEKPISAKASEKRSWSSAVSGAGVDDLRGAGRGARRRLWPPRACGRKRGEKVEATATLPKRSMDFRFLTFDCG